MFTKQLTKRTGTGLCNSCFAWIGNSGKQEKMLQMTNRKCERGGSTFFWIQVSTCSLRNRLYPVWLAWTWGCVHAAFDILENHTEEQVSLTCLSSQPVQLCTILGPFSVFWGGCGETGVCSILSLKWLSKQPLSRWLMAVMDNAAVLIHFNFSCAGRLWLDAIFYIFFP